MSLETDLPKCHPCCLFPHIKITCLSNHQFPPLNFCSTSTRSSFGRRACCYVLEWRASEGCYFLEWRVFSWKLLTWMGRNENRWKKTLPSSFKILAWVGQNEKRWKKTLPFYLDLYLIVTTHVTIDPPFPSLPHFIIFLLLTRFFPFLLWISSWWISCLIIFFLNFSQVFFLFFCGSHDGWVGCLFVFLA